MQRLLLQSLARKKERLLGSNFALVQHAFDAFFVNIACAWAGLQDLALKDDLYVCNVGDSIHWTRWKKIHPCLLPKKKYLYLTGSQITATPPQGFLYALQGIGLSEQRMFALGDHLSVSQSQELCGNAFAANVVAAVVLAAVMYVFDPAQ